MLLSLKNHIAGCFLGFHVILNEVKDLYSMIFAKRYGHKP